MKEANERKETELLRDTYIEIDLSKLEKNVKMIKEMVGGKVVLTAVIKANGYGHGALQIAKPIMEAGADYLAVATLTEALELRGQYADYPILIMGHTPNRLLHHIAEKHLTQTIFSFEQAEILNALGEAQHEQVKVHLKVDTGFHRLGKMPSAEYREEIKKICALPYIDAEGIFSHLALVNEEENEKQYHMFTEFLDTLAEEGCSFRYCHIADSIACVDYPQYRMNMVRPGALLYGMRGYHKGFLPVEQCLSFKTAVSQLHEIEAGEGVSYDFLWKADRKSLIATLPFGYADGYPRNLRDKGYVIINGQKAPIVGVICMDQCMADVTDIEGVCCGSEAIIYGDGTDGSMTIDEASKLSGTNKNDILARLTARPPRIYR